tara:strand:- start:41 stop:580 length:540 start_codon:yes stop_codon:yes gene_type:complete
MSYSKENIEVLFSSEQIAKRVQELGAEITHDYHGTDELVLVGILKGSVIFFSDLARAINLTVRCEFMGISSYGNQTKSSGVVQITSDLSAAIEGKDVLIVEDIVDTGLSMNYLCQNFATRKPKSVRICSLLDKTSNRKIPIGVDYVGFEIPNLFVIGYGLDLAGHYRNLPYVGVYNETK